MKDGKAVHIQNWGKVTLPRQNVLTVGMSYNARVQLSYATADGPGILMNVRRMEPDGFRGTWHQAGRLPAGGYFCAIRTS